MLDQNAEWLGNSLQENAHFVICFFIDPQLYLCQVFLQLESISYQTLGGLKIMLNVCTQCGLYRADKIIDPMGPYAICPECGYQHYFLYLTLLVVAGASGTGKSSVANSLIGNRYQEVVILDSDILWRPEFNKPEDQYRDFFETWLRVCKNIHQSGRSVVIFGAGFGVPSNLENCVESRYFPTIHYLGLVCPDEEILAERLKTRPTWRGTTGHEFIAGQQNFNQWFMNYNQNNNQPPIEILDTCQYSLQETTKQVKAWIQNHLYPEQP